jgi:hypothetical protein
MVQNLLSSSLLSKNLKIKTHRTIILPFVMYGCVTWLLTLREEHRLRRVFENRVLMRIFGPKRDEVTGEWRKLHNEELRSVLPPNIIRVIKLKRIRWVWRVPLVVERRGAYRVLVGRPSGKRLLERPRLRQEDNIKMELQELRYEGMAGFELAQDRDRWQTLVKR